ncbi:hypothetical protein CC2G_011432 [Coprinopsis cinerea AmutBmut pab1-1]|nr:hypothetical protein CC2G_011432 [Coprinopsis cinerea AmutBmut pab1-1]
MSLQLLRQRLSKWRPPLDRTRTSPTLLRLHSTHSQAERVFSNTGAADFLAAAASPKSFPNFNGLPEIALYVTSILRESKRWKVNAL